MSTTRTDLYFAPDGPLCRRFRPLSVITGLDFRDRVDRDSSNRYTDCQGIDHMEFTADGRYLIATCEFNGHLMKVDLGDASSRRVPLVLDATGTGPRCHRTFARHPTARVFRGRHEAEWCSPRRSGCLAQSSVHPDGRGTHGLYPQPRRTLILRHQSGWNTLKAGRHGPGSVSVIDPVARTVVATWPVPGGGSPDMGNVTADGKELWVSGRYDDEVYVFDTSTGALTHRIPVGREPHGLCVWPQPGRYSLGHTGNMR